MFIIFLLNFWRYHFVIIFIFLRNFWRSCSLSIWYVLSSLFISPSVIGDVDIWCCNHVCAIWYSVCLANSELVWHNSRPVCGFSTIVKIRNICEVFIKHYMVLRWYYGDTWPVRGSRTRSTLAACDGEWPTWTLTLEFGCHFSIWLREDWIPAVRT